NWFYCLMRVLKCLRNIEIIRKKQGRAVARGYVTVNGKEVELTEDTKQQLLKTDKEASAAREKAYQDWLIVSRNSILP
ncbi:MAG: hypothetical protein ACM67P_05555, partial [Clostridiales bacterium]